ncbi:uncharacterized protein LOC123037172 [Drosophila rhopaloa]|uniref:Integrase catalytic domain-containing protein n=1 Tax=Drosophila rhopaloa TaxID=1041015 RepID=A0ABM5J1N8_DRORH|nr:uncharacterized protein LOC123037172 [Drosophila rhopaloa]
MYIAVFVCFASKAVHLELVTNLSTDSFLLALKSFIARRGVPHRVHSDNATNFVGARNELRSLQRAFEKGIEWRFIPPRAPHFGGLWEAAVKSAKEILVRQVADASLTEAEHRSQRGHLLIGQALCSLPQGLELDAPNRGLRFSKRWQLRQRFWQAWSKEYVHSLQRKTKWQTTSPNLEVGALVIIHEDNTPPQRWITGRVFSVVAGADGKIQVAEIKTATGVFKRPIQKLAALPIY